MAIQAASTNKNTKKQTGLRLYVLICILLHWSCAQVFWILNWFAYPMLQNATHW